MEASWWPSTRNKNLICLTCTAIHTILSSAECRSLSGNHQSKCRIFSRIFSCWSRLLICKHCQICFIHFNQNWEWYTIWGVAISIEVLEGVSNLRPALPRNSTTFDVSVVFMYIQSLQTLKSCDFKSLSNCCQFFCKLQLVRGNQTFVNINIDAMMFEVDKVTIFFPELLKQSQPGHHLETMVFFR